MESKHKRKGDAAVGAGSGNSSVSVASTHTSVDSRTSTVNSSSLTCSTVTSKKEFLDGRLTQTGAQDTSRNNFDQEGNRGNIRLEQSGSDGTHMGISDSGRAKSEVKDVGSRGPYAHPGESQLRKSTSPSSRPSPESVLRRGHHGDQGIQTPFSSPRSGQTEFSGRTGATRTCTAPCDMGKLSSQYAARQKQKSNGFLNIFKWFRNRDKKRFGSVDRISINSSESLSSLTSATSSFAYIPIMRSKSAGNQKDILTPCSVQSQTGTTRRYKLFSKESSLNRLKSDSKRNSQFSAISASSVDSSVREGSSRPSSIRKKRPAPQPPGSPKSSESGSLKSCTSLPSRDLIPVTGAAADIPEGRRLQKSKSEGLICRKTKRRAPLPPVQVVAQRFNAENQDKGAELEKGATGTGSNGRPTDSVSSTSSLSQSLSSISTLQSRSSSANSALHSTVKSTSSSCVSDDSKSTLTPRPWYKRKKKENDSSKDPKTSMKKEKVYDTWMPEIQFSRKLNLTGTFQKNKSNKNDTKESPTKTKEDEKKEKRQSQVSLLASISELDRAASEQMQRELEEKKAQKAKYDNKFYKASEPRILTQRDFLPGQQEHFSATAQDETRASRLWYAGRNEAQDNFQRNEHGGTLPESYSKQSTLRVEKINGNHSFDDNCSGNDLFPLDLESLRNSLECDSLPDLFMGSQQTPGSPSQTRESPLQKAVIDAELFYQLAKDSKTSVDVKAKNSPNALRRVENRKQTRSEEVEEESSGLDISDVFGHFRRQSKNFGLRMNNFFSPDVSTILETSESMTSTATTPGDEIYEDVSMPMSVAERRKTDSFHEELISEANYEFRLNSSDAREIIQEIADVREEIENIRKLEEEEARKDSDKRRANKIKAELSFFRDRESFEFWQGKATASNVAPIPIEINENSERKLKWVCETCTLINLPWRLQCEACMKRRPSNPKRVDEDGNSVSSEHPSSPHTGSSESPVTVIHDDGVNARTGNIAGEEAGNTEDVSPTRDQEPTGKNRKDINWEVELQKYFRTFDEHTRNQNDMTDVSEQNPVSEGANLPQAEASYSKVSKNSKHTQNAPGSGEKHKGAKPKTKKFGSAFSEEEIRESYELYNAKANIVAGTSHNVDLDEVRRLRLAKFQEGNLHQLMDSETTFADQEVKKNTKEKKKTKTKNKPKNAEEEGGSSKNDDQRVMPNSQEKKKEEKERSPNEAEKTFYAKSYSKPQVLKPSGAVRSVISVFNQMDQIHQINKEKPKVTRRRSFGNVSGRAQLFESLNSGSNSPELPRSQKVMKEVPKPYQKVEILKDKDIVSAIAKFDEMAALAEIEKIEKLRVKNETAKKKPWSPSVFSVTATKTSTSVTNVTSTSNFQNTTLQTNNTQCSGNSENLSESSEALIKGGILYTEQRKRSMSIGSGTFELIEAKDFENFEAQHNESLLSTASGTSEPAGASASMSATNGPTATASNPIAEQTSHSNAVALVPKSESVDEWKRDIENKELERLSHQLTVPDGIATFKANLKVEEQSLGHTNTLNINRLLRKLESAISQGNHAKAAQLAHELAELKISCSVIRNKRKAGTESIVSQEDSSVVSFQTTRSHLRPSTLAYEDREAPPVPYNYNNNDAEFVEATTPSNVSECFYDASERFENEHADSNDYEEYENEGFVYQENAVSDVLSAVREGDNKPLQIANKEAKSPLSAPPSIPAHVEAAPNASPTPSRREVRVDPARREVKSDNISKLTDESSVDVKDVSNAPLPFTVKMYVEDKNSHQGPISFTVVSTMTVGELREKVYQNFGFPPHVQRWILGKLLADDDTCTLERHKVTSEGCPIFLYLVAPQTESQDRTREAPSKTEYSYAETLVNSVPSSHAKSFREECEGEVIYENINSDRKEYGVLNRGEPANPQPVFQPRQMQEVKYAPVPQRVEIRPIVNSAATDSQANALSANPPNGSIYQKQNIAQVAQYGKINPTAKKVEKEAVLQPVPAKAMKRETTEMTIQLQVPQHQQPQQKAQPQQPQQNLQPQQQKTQPQPQQKPPPHQQPQAVVGHEPSTSNLVQQSPIPKKTAKTQDRAEPVAETKQPQQTATQLQRMQQTTQIAVPATQPPGSKAEAVDIGNQQAKSDSNVPKKKTAQNQRDPKVASPKQRQRRAQQPEKSQPAKANEQHLAQAPAPAQTPTQTQAPAQAPAQSAPLTPETLTPKDHKGEAAKQPVSSPVREASAPDAKSAASKVHGWMCPTCTLVNKWERPGCEACATERPGSEPLGKGAAAEKGSGLGADVSALERQGFVPNREPFECRICFLDFNEGEGAVLRDCLHTFCRECLANAIKYSDTAMVKCPYRDDQYSCDSSLQDREIKALVTPQEYDKHLTKSVKQAEGAMENVYHCKTPDCPGFCQFEDNVNIFQCEVCNKVNCLTCQAQHNGVSCKEYQDDLANKVDEAAMKTKKFFDDMIRRGDGLPCPKCSVMLVRKWGCDWMRCPMCRTEICWVTRGPRWGPGGPGDVSGGCKCGIRGQKCHPKCTYCH
ncbi:uncharacterized protein LOC122264097 isoform X2 [Penaeus japonicus]|nr:uncharacterized protein LOC122264097 isoform X2 [Penaeus japonicus]XP_042888732.1 uncharacterized protein LOC122264097 isoform X2 [Penaeus japonicus]XP_042888734.1 uncharacterized protein LOC122264097 isoform X2 [Penaeus japonicus]XP_042888735.1 uncharacterized protein LOC122264097 isoform X2 [Penaeus japonicus]XP_042888736.1 uncharacterized protein LOC122264097 isoform X2 [Penaeus japonicus]